MVNDTGRVTELGVGVTPVPSGPGALLLASEEPRKTAVVLLVRGGGLEDVPAVVWVHGVLSSQLGYPNDEAYWSHGAGYGFYRINDSTWQDQLAEYNSKAFASGGRWPSGYTHFFVGCHDVSCQFLAKDLTVEVKAGMSWDEVVAETLRIVQYLD